MATADFADFFKRVPLSYTWIIENVSELTYINLKSPPFVEPSIGKKALYLQIDETVDFRCYLRSEDDFLEEEFYGTDIEISLLATDGSTLISKRNVAFELFATLLSKDAFLEKKAEFIPNNTLIVQCRIWRIKHVTGLCFARTKLDTYRRSVVWGIEEFSALHSSNVEDSGELSSDEIKVYSLGSLPQEESSLALILYLKKNSESEDVYVDFLIKSERGYTFRCGISVLDTNGKGIESKVEGGLKSEIFKFRPLISKSKLMANKDLFLPNDTLILKCSFEICFLNFSSGDIEYCTQNVSYVPSIYGVIMKFHRDMTDENITKEPFSNEEDGNDNTENIIQEPLSDEDDIDDDIYGDNDIHDEYEDENFESAWKENVTDFCTESCSLKSALRYLHHDTAMSDINLRLGTKIYPAHKNILCSRSPVFQKMLNNDVTKKTIQIENMNENTLGHLHRYIYADAVGNIEFADALDLYKAADDYQLFDLRYKCSDILVNNLCKDNALDLLSLAKKYQDKELESRAQEIYEFYRKIDALKEGPSINVSDLMNDI